MKTRIKYTLMAILSLLIALMLQNYLLNALLCLKWQVKALAINNILGGPVDSWWTESPLKVAFDVFVADKQNIVQVVIAVVTGTIQHFIRRPAK